MLQQQAEHLAHAKYRATAKQVLTGGGSQSRISANSRDAPARAIGSLGPQGGCGPIRGNAPPLGVPEGRRLPMLVGSSSLLTFGIARMTLALGCTILGA